MYTTEISGGKGEVGTPYRGVIIDEGVGVGGRNMSAEKIFGLWVSGIQAGTRDGTSWQKGGSGVVDPTRLK